jgi:L,D-transpeptidase ErfK/SrfK
MPYRLKSLACFVVLVIFVLQPARGEKYTIKGDLIGAERVYTAQYEDTLYQIARHFDLGIVEVMAANPGVDPWMPGAGTRIKLPLAHILPAAPRQGIVINLPEFRLYLYDSDGQVYSFPIGVGKEGWQTPTGDTRLVKKRENPVWVPPESIRAEKPDLPQSVPAGPHNPLGSHALNMGWPGYVIHGTNQPYGIGRQSSHGCIRLYPEDISVLFNLVSVGTPVTVVDQSYKMGWYKNTLLLEVTPLQQQSDDILEHGHIRTPAPPENIEGDIAAIAGENTTVDWRAVKKALQERSGIPVPIGRKI